MDEVVILRVDVEGKVVASSEPRGPWSENSETRSCQRVVNARAPSGSAVCTVECARQLAKGMISGHEDESTIIHGRHGRLDCQRVGDDVIVIIRRSNIEESGDGARITPREKEVLGLVLQGKTSREIALQLALQPSTVRTHMEHAMRRLGVRTRAEAVGRALATGQLESTGRRA